MSKNCVEHVFNGLTVVLPTYDSTKTMIGDAIIQNSGASDLDSWVGPAPVGYARPQEVSTAYASAFPYVIDFSSTISWVFLADNTAAGATRRITLYTYNKSTQDFSWSGFITLTFPTATSHTIRAYRVARYLYTTGTVGVSGTAVTGSGTSWSTARYASGARIGFGSTNPTQISQWYVISSIDSNTGITLSSSAGTIASGTSYVIEELRIVVATTNATTTNGGLFLAKGINIMDFSGTGTTIAAAISTDNVKAVYWLKDASTITMTTAAGVGFLPAASDTQHDLYFLNSESSSIRIFSFNLRAALTVSSGASTNAFVLKTGVPSALTGVVSQTNNGRYANASHGPGSGVPSIYFVTTTRIYRAQISLIVDSSTNFIVDSMVEIPAGSTSTFAASGAMSSIEYSSEYDRFIITTNGSSKQYITSYNTNADPMDVCWGINDFQLDQSTMDPGAIPHVQTASTAFSVWSEAGYMYICKNGSTAGTNILYCVPAKCHWDWASSTNQRVITPALATPNSTKYYRVYVNSQEWIGTANLGQNLEPIRVYARSSGISDNSGAWTLLPQNNSLSTIPVSSQIQFMIEYRICGGPMLPGRVYALTCVYEDFSTDSHFQPSAGLSSTTNNRFAWRFSTAFGGTVPTLRVRLYDATNNNLLVDDYTNSPTGTFEKSTNGGSSWGSWNTTDKGNETTYLRYTPASIGTGITVRALLTQ